EQALVELDADEPKADVRSKEATVKELQHSLERLKVEPRQEEKDEAQATLESAQVSAKQAHEYFDRINPLWEQGAIPAQRFHDAKAALHKAEAEQRAAKARLEKLKKRPIKLEFAELEARIAAAKANVDAAKAELEHYMVVAPIDGVVTSLEV